MGYSNDYREIRNGFVNYIGAALNSVSKFEGDSARQYITAMLIEEAINLCKDEDSINLYSIKPLLKGCKVVCEDRINALSEIAAYSKDAQKQLDSYNIILSNLENIINNIKI